jgi:hypothetical protein
MKVYVDELPEKCEDCVFSETGFVWDSEVRFCKLKPRYMNWIALYDKKRKDCNLCSLSEYTKQVRKEVCEEIRKWCDKNFNWVGDGTGYDGQDYSEMIGSNNTINKLRELLDQLKNQINTD